MLEVVVGGSILSCCHRHPHGHERVLKEDQKLSCEVFNIVKALSK